MFPPIQGAQLSIISHFLPSCHFFHEFFHGFMGTNMASSSQFFSIILSISNFSMPSWKHWRFMYIPSILKILLTLIWEPTIPILCWITNQHKKTIVHAISTMPMDIWLFFFYHFKNFKMTKLLFHHWWCHFFFNLQKVIWNCGFRTLRNKVRSLGTCII